MSSRTGRSGGRRSPLGEKGQVAPDTILIGRYLDVNVRNSNWCTESRTWKRASWYELQCRAAPISEFVRLLASTLYVREVAMTHHEALEELYGEFVLQHFFLSWFASLWKSLVWRPTFWRTWLRGGQRFAQWGQAALVGQQLSDGCLPEQLLRGCEGIVDSSVQRAKSGSV